MKTAAYYYYYYYYYYCNSISMAFVSVLLCHWHCATFSHKDCVRFPSVGVNEARCPNTQQNSMHFIRQLYILHSLWLGTCIYLNKRKGAVVEYTFWSHCHGGKKKSPWKSVKPHCFWLKCAAVAENQYKDSHSLSAYIEVLQNIYQTEVFWSCCSVICTVRSPVVALQVETSSVTKRTL